MLAAIRTPIAPGGIKSYYQAKIEAAELTINQKTQNLRRLEAQRNALNARGLYYLCVDRKNRGLSSDILCLHSTVTQRRIATTS
jgi:hypothetical protein